MDCKARVMHTGMRLASLLLELMDNSRYVNHSIRAAYRYMEVLLGPFLCIFALGFTNPSTLRGVVSCGDFVRGDCALPDNRPVCCTAGTRDRPCVAVASSTSWPCMALAWPRLPVLYSTRTKMLSDCRIPSVTMLQPRMHGSTIIQHQDFPHSPH